MIFKNPSLKFWLLSTLGMAFLIFYIFIVILTYYEAKHEVNEIYDAQLLSTLSTIESLVKPTEIIQVSDYQSKLVKKLDLSNYYSPVFVSVIFPNHQSILSVDPEFKKIITEYKDLLISNQNKIITLSEGEQDWRVISTSKAHPYPMQLIVGEPIEYRNAAVWEIINVMALPVIIGLPLMLFLFSIIINMGFKKFHKFIDDFTKQSPLEVISNKVESDCPVELQPLVLEIQQLLVRAQKQTNQEKQFTANAAHELKTPLAALKLQVDLLEKDLHNAQLAQKTLKDVKNTIQRTENLISQLLNLQKLEVAEISFHPVSLSEIFSEVHQLLTPILESNKQEIVYRLPEKDVIVYTDMFWCKQLLVNLISNAIHYSPPKSLIEIVLSQRSSNAILTIEDSGEGLTEDEIERVTQCFYRLDKHKGQPNGSGLGLSIVKEICRKYQIHFKMDQSQKLGGLKVTLMFHVEPKLV